MKLRGDVLYLHAMSIEYIPIPLKIQQSEVGVW